ncbi:hypothetical protein BV25DRAFT_1104074 [Artomyces pyxidatus]|uniref:Uncharacterized protein n=1 Tax=Artomyces pyxidatus TaxID=48021 RepID=A0ACB8TGB2_9AGAM|nr:hypothetical protein BV25DRAFT_1104074 [Artomyces pyxidatus]
MQDTTPDSFNWPQRAASPSSDSALEVKSEQAQEARPVYIGSSSPSPGTSKSVSTASIPSSARRHSSSVSSHLRRSKHPYPTSARDVRLQDKRGEDTGKMANPNYNQWIKTENEVDRQQAYAFAASGAANPAMRRPGFGEDARPRSSGSNMTSSSLRGAMGDIRLSSNSEDSSSPSPTSEGSQHRPASSSTYNVASGMVWTQSNPDVPGQAGMPPTSFDGSSASMSFHHMNSPSTSLASGSSSTSYLQYQDYNNPNYTNPSPSGPHSPHSPPMFPPSSYPDQFGSYGQGRPQAALGGHAMISPQSVNFPPSGRGPIPITSSNTISSGSRTSRPVEDELRYLRNKVRELELINESARLRMRELESELASPMHGSSYPSSAVSGLPAPPPTAPVSSSFAASWKARTDARVKLFCSLNRAGNALCAWHDSRRERRAHPPRMAPPGHLNCGCTFEEALFEESLSRHDVGSYHPGENVRMDPALRNPLLKLLQERYGYRDGDFERDPVTGNWVDGEGHGPWEARAMSGASSHRKHRTDERR